MRRWLLILGALGLLPIGLWLGHSAAQVPSTQCVVSAAAGGASDAITIPTLPCVPTTALLVLTTQFANLTTTPTIQYPGGGPKTVVLYTGSVLPVGVFQPGGTYMLVFNGTNWKVLSVTSGGAQNIILGSTNMVLGGSYPTLTGVSFDWNLAGWTTQTGTAYQIQQTDCGKGIRFTANSAVSVTVPATLSIGCFSKWKQVGSGKVSYCQSGCLTNLLATITSPHGFTGTYSAGSEVFIDVDTNPGGSSATASFGGDGS